MSLPVRGAWIEILSSGGLSRSAMSLPVRGAWIEIVWKYPCILPCDPSLPVRGAWIEILYTELEKVGWKVAPCEGSVD